MVGNMIILFLFISWRCLIFKNFSYNEEGDQVFGIYRKEEISKFQIVVSTLCAATYLVSGGLHDKFT